jgi:tetratricopeptide (TPR) repeat protein
MTGAEYAQHFNCGVRALEAYEREGSPEQADVAQKAFTNALRSVPADLPETERDRYRAAALGNLARVWYARGASTGAVQAVHQAMRHLNEVFRLSDEESTAANLASVLRLCQGLLPKHDVGELTEALALLRELKERAATRGGALTFDATIALFCTYEERLRRREDEGDRLALAETAEEMARIAVQQDREDAAGYLKAASAHFLAVADHPGEGEGYARKALDLAADALALT